MLPMQRVFSILIIVGIIVWAFLLLERAQPDRRVEELTEQFDDANTLTDAQNIEQRMITT